MLNVAITKAVRACNLRCGTDITSKRENYRMMMPEEIVQRLNEGIARYLRSDTGFAFIWHGGEPSVAMYVADWFIRAPDKASSEFYLAHTISEDTVQVPVDHRCELIKRFHPLPFRPREKPLRRHRTRPRSLNEHSGRDKKCSALKHEDVVNA
jgi:hypothetical protein